MNKLQTLLAAAMCGVILSAVSTQAQPAMQGYGTVVRVVGQVSYTLGDNVWHPLQAGKYLPVGSSIRTGHNGIADVVLGKESFAPDAPVRGMINYKPSAEQNVIRVTPNSTVAIEKLTITDTGADTVSDTELNLKQGKIYASVKKISGASQYLIKLPNGIAGVRGTLLGISANGDVECFESKNGGLVLSLIGPNGSPLTILIAPGQVYSPGSGVSPMPQSLFNSLNDVFRALKTIYVHVVDYSFDHTDCWISPTQGGKGKGKGKGNGNGGGGGNED